MVDYHKASKLVQHITDIIEQYPERFEDFLCALRAFNWLEDTLKSVLEEYEVNQTKCRETKVYIAWIIIIELHSRVWLINQDALETVEMDIASVNGRIWLIGIPEDFLTSFVEPRYW